MAVEVTIKIGPESRSMRDADESWINKQINGRRKEYGSVCVRVWIVGPDIDIALATADCGDRGGGGRPPRPPEAQVVELWKRLGLDSPSFQGGNVVAFTKQLKHLFR